MIGFFVAWFMFLHSVLLMGQTIVRVPHDWFLHSLLQVFGLYYGYYMMGFFVACFISGLCSDNFQIAHGSFFIAWFKLQTILRITHDRFLHSLFMFQTISLITHDRLRHSRFMVLDYITYNT